MTENCPMRHENGNCIPAGGFCTANKNICEALLNAYKMGKTQLSPQGTTKDAISRRQALEKVRAMQTYKLFVNDDMLLVDKAEVQTELMMIPTIQPEKTQLSPQYTTSDLISRQAAIDVVKRLMGDYELSRTVQTGLHILPSAQPERKKGEWIPHEFPDGGEQYECSECGVLWEFTEGTPEDNEAYFCPKCGTKMKGERQK